MSGCCKQSNSGRNRLPVLIIPISILFLAVLAVFLFSPGKTAPPVVLTPENFPVKPGTFSPGLRLKRQKEEFP